MATFSTENITKTRPFQWQFAQEIKLLWGLLFYPPAVVARRSHRRAAECIILNTMFLVFDTQFLGFDTQFLVLLQNSSFLLTSALPDAQPDEPPDIFLREMKIHYSVSLFGSTMYAVLHSAEFWSKSIEMFPSWAWKWWICIKNDEFCTKIALKMMDFVLKTMNSVLKLPSWAYHFRLTHSTEVMRHVIRLAGRRSDKLRKTEGNECKMSEKSRF